MIVKNEANIISKNLEQAAHYIDELIIVDTGSTDNTLEIVKKYGAKVKEIAWKHDFATARNEAISLATQDWILILDADEVLKKEDGIQLSKFLKTKEANVYDGFILTVCNFITPGNETSAEKNKSLRVFKNDNQIKYKGKVHEQVINYTKINEIPLTVYHYGYLKTEIARKNKHERNRTLLVNSLKEDPNNNYYKYHLAINSYSDKKYTESIEILEKLIPNFTGAEAYAPRAYKCLIMSYKRLGKFKEMINTANAAIEKWPRYTDLYYMKALAQYNLGKYGSAIFQIKKCLQLGDPKEFDSHNGVGSTRALMLSSNIYQELGRYKEALVDLTKLVNILPDSPSVYVKYCEVLLKLNNKSLVINLLKKYCNKYNNLTNSIIDELFKKRQYELVLEVVNHSKNISLLSAYQFALSCSYLKKYDIALKNLMLLLPKFQDDMRHKIERHIYYCYWLSNRKVDASLREKQYFTNNKDDVKAKVFRLFINSLNYKIVDFELLTNIPVKQTKRLVLELILELENYNNDDIVKALHASFIKLNITAKDLIYLFDERAVHDYYVQLYVNEQNLTSIQRYKRFISLSKNKMKSLYSFLIKEGNMLLESGATLIKVYSALAECYQIKAEMVRRNIFE